MWLVTGYDLCTALPVFPLVGVVTYTPYGECPAFSFMMWRYSRQKVELMHKLRQSTAAQLSVNRYRDWRLALPDSNKQIPPHKLNIQLKLITSHSVFAYSAKKQLIIDRSLDHCSVRTGPVDDGVCGQPTHHRPHHSQGLCVGYTISLH